MVECLSDNANRTISQVRPSFTKCGGNLGTEGSVGYLFSKKGLILISQGEEDALMEAAIEAVQMMFNHKMMVHLKSILRGKI